jgi:3-deoxy-D-manno-octulosonic acid kinase
VPAPPPTGYRPIEAAGADGVARETLAGSLTTILAHGTLYDYARRQPDRREFTGRGPVYAISIAGTPIVVRRVRHGGLLALLTRDVFVRPTRAPYELAVSTKLREGGVATPEVLAYVVYRAGPVLRRADVLTREIADAADLPTVLGPATAAADRAVIWDAVRALIADLSRVGAVHPDLNVKNVLIARGGQSPPVAYILDVDRVVWRRPGDPAVARANWARLDRSARKQGLL